MSLLRLHLDSTSQICIWLVVWGVAINRDPSQQPGMIKYIKKKQNTSRRMLCVFLLFPLASGESTYVIQKHRELIVMPLWTWDLCILWHVFAWKRATKYFITQNLFWVIKIMIFSRLPTFQCRIPTYYLPPGSFYHAEIGNEGIYKH